MSPVGRRLSALAVAAVVVVLARVASPVFVPVASFVGDLLGRLSSVVPASVGEISALLSAIAGIVLIFRGCRRARRGDVSWRSLLMRGALNVAVLAAVLTATFYLTWGVHYFRPSLDERLGWERRTVELESLCSRLVTLTNFDRMTVGGTAVDRRTIDAAIEEGYARAVSLFGLPDGWARPRPRVKPLATSELFSRLGISGVYMPWTGEANFNRLVPLSELPHVLAHEKAHQRGVAPEDEAEFVGFLAAISSSDPWVRYSGHLWAQRLLLGELYRRDPDAALRLVERRLPEVQRDVDAAREHWSQFRGPLRTAGRRVNDGYLKLQGVESGIESYGEAARLVLIWAARQHDVPD